MYDLDRLVRASENRMPTEVKAVVQPKPAPRPLNSENVAFGLVAGEGLETLVQPPPPVPPALDPGMLGRVENIGFGGAKPSTTELERLIGTNDLVDEFYLQRALVAARPVMRIVLRDSGDRERGWATGFMVSPNLLLTNHHVFTTIDETQNAIAEANYVLDIAGNPAQSFRFAVRGDLFYYAVEELDFALVALEPTAQDGKTTLAAFGYHRLNPQPNKILEKECITLIQHPGGEQRQLAIRENELVKITGGYLWYTSDTAPGSSGAPAFNDSFQVVALHHSGAAKRDDATGQYVLKDGTKADSLKNVPENQVVWVANEGIRISTLCAHLFSAAGLNRGDPLVRGLLDAMTGGDIISNALKGKVSVSPIIETESAISATGALPAVQAPLAANGAVQLPPAASGAVLTIPVQLNIQISVIGAAQPLQPIQLAAVAPARTELGYESALAALSQIKVDRDYTNRAGYDPAFLGVHAPLLVVTDPSQVSQLDNGSYILPYEHFSVVLSKKRRLPLFTASNVDYSEKKRHPEPGKYGRKDLTGTDKEIWLLDPRIPPQDQLPDRFYNLDGGSFDKGHIVRREDVCWGDSYAQVVRGNCDTFHVTNCTPQVAGFNRSNEGLNDWGDLEDEIRKQAKAERLCILAGPILSSQDRFFTGKDDFGQVKIQIPKEYWKVVLANVGGKLKAFAFILEQDLTSVPLEFAVNATWKQYQISIAALEARVEGICFPPEIHAADDQG